MGIELFNVSKYYGNFKALDNLSFEIKTNAVNSIVGHNGSGKTTLVKCLSTLLLIDSGKITFFGEAFNYKEYNRFRKRISLLLDASRNLYLNLTLIQNIKYFLQIKGTFFKDKESKINKYLEQFSLLDHKDKLVSSLSKGMQQKTALIIALAQESDLVILDEPNLGLDFDSLYTLKLILSQECKNRTIILTTQDIKLIEDVSTYLSVLDNGLLKYTGKIEDFNTYSPEVICSLYLDKEPTENIKMKITPLANNLDYKENVIYGNFQKSNFDSILKVLQSENYSILDIKTHEGFDNNLKAILSDRSKKQNVSIS